MLGQQQCYTVRDACATSRRTGQNPAGKTSSGLSEWQKKTLSDGLVTQEIGLGRRPRSIPHQDEISNWSFSCLPDVAKGSAFPSTFAPNGVGTRQCRASLIMQVLRTHCLRLRPTPKLTIFSNRCNSFQSARYINLHPAVIALSNQNTIQTCENHSLTNLKRG